MWVSSLLYSLLSWAQFTVVYLSGILSNEHNFEFWAALAVLYPQLVSGTTVPKLMMATLFSASTALLSSEAEHNIYKVFGNVIQETILTIYSGNLVLHKFYYSSQDDKLDIIFSISIFSLLGAGCTRWAFGEGQGGWDLREEWDESCLCGGRKLQMEQCFQVKWITIAIPTTNQVCDHATQHGLCFLWKQKHFSQGKLRFLVVVLDETKF